MSVAFSRRRLEWLVRSLGTDLARWPAAERHAALDLLRVRPRRRPCSPKRSRMTKSRFRKR